jgi:hypothetical protein
MISVKCLRTLQIHKLWTWKRPLLSGHYDLGTEGRVRGFSIKKKGSQICQISKEKFQQLSDFAKNIEWIIFFSYWHISTCGQIWLNHFPDDSHLGLLHHKIGKKKLWWGRNISLNGNLEMKCGWNNTLKWSFSIKSWVRYLLHVIFLSEQDNLWFLVYPFTPPGLCLLVGNCTW